MVSEHRQANTDCEITPQMVEAGFRVLCNSGMSDEYLAADKSLVTEIFLAMLGEMGRSHQVDAEDQGAYIFRIAEALPVIDPQSHIEW